MIISSQRTLTWENGYPGKNIIAKRLQFSAGQCLPSEMFTPLNFVNDKSELNNKERAIQLGRSLFRRGRPAGRLPCSLMRRHSAATSVSIGVSLRLNKN